MLGLSVGLTKKEMGMMGDPENCPTFDETDKLVLRYAEVLTRDVRVDDPRYAALSSRFSNEELVDLATTLRLASFINRMHATFRTDLDGPTQAAVGDAVACTLPTFR